MGPFGLRLKRLERRFLGLRQEQRFYVVPWAVERRSNGAPWIQRWGAAAAAGGAVIVLAGYVLLLGRGAAWLDAGSLRGLTPEQRATEINSMRGYLIQAGAGVLAFGALVYTALNFSLSREGHVTDRYTKAIEQLGSQRLDVRLGAIYALERIMIDSPRDHPTIVEVLAAFVREHADDAIDPPPGEDPASSGENARPRADASAALEVLGRRPPGRTERGPLTFAGKYLAGADLNSADLSFILLARADLSRTKLDGAKLAGVDLVGANLTGAALNRAAMPAAILDNANLTGVRAILANLSGASLERASLRSADLTWAKLVRANLAGADLTGADLTSADLTDARLVGADLTGATLRGANMTGAVFQNTRLTNVSLEKLELTAEQRAGMMGLSGGGA